MLFSAILLNNVGCTEREAPESSDVLIKWVTSNNSEIVDCRNLVRKVTATVDIITGTRYQNEYGPGSIKYEMGQYKKLMSELDQFNRLEKCKTLGMPRSDIKEVNQAVQAVNLYSRP